MCKGGSVEGLSVETAVRDGNCQIYYLNFQQALHQLQYNKYKQNTDSSDANLCKMSHLVIFESA
jgi:hypothetical protein